jgi:3-oxoacyl-[acyl-carrier protein] reductase
VAADGVTVNTVQPGLHRTDRVEQIYDAASLAQMTLGEADDFGAIVAFLCSEQARFTTGAHLNVD